MSFAACDLSFRWGVRGIGFQLPESGFVAIAGPNGAGKSTLVSILAGVNRNYAGSCTFAGREVKDWPRKEFARRVAFLPQLVATAHPFLVAEVVAMGRAPHASGWRTSPDDSSAALRAMQQTDVTNLAKRDFRSLSGGERQRVLVAAALAQDAGVLVLDEPATFLDLGHELAVYGLLQEIAESRLVVAVMHDLNYVLRFATEVLLLREGQLKAQGLPRDVLNGNRIQSVFSVPPHMMSHFREA